MANGLSQALDTIVRAATSSERIASTTVMQSLWSGYGSIYRCSLVGGACESVVVKSVRWPTQSNHPRGWNSDVSHQRKVRSYEVETNWYTNFAENCDLQCRVPQCLATESHGDGIVIVLEDLNEAGFAARSTCGDVALFSCLAWLAHFHATFLGSHREGLWDIGTYWNLETRPEEFAVLPAGSLKDAAAEIDRRLNSAAFQTLVHGDAKLANFCFAEGGTQVAAVDFQYVGGGCGMKDVAYFLSSCLDEDECETREAEMLDYYFARLRESLAVLQPNVDVVTLEREWRDLYPLAWTDFYRFLQGWSPGHWKVHRYSRRLAGEVLAAL
tara:strand:- start:26686 stop:27666 length:981 start_codon:yes stop_codon:yes gene_type:complete